MYKTIHYSSDLQTSKVNYSSGLK